MSDIVVERLPDRPVARLIVVPKSNLRRPTKSRSANFCETPRAGAIANATIKAEITWAKV